MLNIGIVLNNISNITVTSMVGNGWNFVGISSVALESWTGYNTGLLTGNRWPVWPGYFMSNEILVTCTLERQGLHIISQTSCRAISVFVLNCLCNRLLTFLWILVWRYRRMSVLQVVLEVLVNFGILVVGRSSDKDIILSVILVKNVTLLFEFLNDFIWILGKADRFISLASCNFTCPTDFFARRFIIEDGLGFLGIPNINHRLDDVFWIWRNSDFINLRMVWRVAFNGWTLYETKLLAGYHPWIVGNNLMRNVVSRVAALKVNRWRVVCLSSLVVFVNVVNRFRNNLLFSILVGCIGMRHAMLQIDRKLLWRLVIVVIYRVSWECLGRVFFIQNIALLYQISQRLVRLRPVYLFTGLASQMNRLVI